MTGVYSHLPPQWGQGIPADSQPWELLQIPLKDRQIIVTETFDCDHYSLTKRIAQVWLYMAEAAGFEYYVRSWGQVSTNLNSIKWSRVHNELLILLPELYSWNDSATIICIMPCSYMQHDYEHWPITTKMTWLYVWPVIGPSLKVASYLGCQYSHCLQHHQCT